MTMSQIFDFLFSQYAGYDTLDIVLELLAALFTVVSVVYAKKNNVLVFPTGMICTAIFVYLLLKWGLLGDMINQWILFHHERIWLVCLDP